MAQVRYMTWLVHDLLPDGTKSLGAVRMGVDVRLVYFSETLLGFVPAHTTLDAMSTPAKDDAARQPLLSIALRTGARALFEQHVAAMIARFAGKIPATSAVVDAGQAVLHDADAARLYGRELYRELAGSADVAQALKLDLFSCYSQIAGFLNVPFLTAAMAYVFAQFLVVPGTAAIGAWFDITIAPDKGASGSSGSSSSSSSDASKDADTSWPSSDSSLADATLKCATCDAEATGVCLACRAVVYCSDACFAADAGAHAAACTAPLAAVFDLQPRSRKARVVNFFWGHDDAAAADGRVSLVGFDVAERGPILDAYGAFEWLTKVGFLHGRGMLRYEQFVGLLFDPAMRTVTIAEVDKGLREMREHTVVRGDKAVLFDALSASFHRMRFSYNQSGLLKQCLTIRLALEQKIQTDEGRLLRVVAAAVDVLERDWSMVDDWVAVDYAECMELAFFGNKIKVLQLLQQYTDTTYAINMLVTWGLLAAVANDKSLAFAVQHAPADMRELISNKNTPPEDIAGRWSASSLRFFLENGYLQVAAAFVFDMHPSRGATDDWVWLFDHMPPIVKHKDLFRLCGQPDNAAGTRHFAPPFAKPVYRASFYDDAYLSKAVTRDTHPRVARVLFARHPYVARAVGTNGRGFLRDLIANKASLELAAECIRSGVFNMDKFVAETVRTRLATILRRTLKLLRSIRTSPFRISEIVQRNRSFYKKPRSDDAHDMKMWRAIHDAVKRDV